MSSAVERGELPSWTGRGGAESKWVIWSEEHSAWWAPGSRGYTNRLREAGRYRESEAHSIAEKANRYLSPGTFNEVAMPDPFVAHRVRYDPRALGQTALALGRIAEAIGALEDGRYADADEAIARGREYLREVASLLSSGALARAHYSPITAEEAERKP